MRHTKQRGATRYGDSYQTWKWLPVMGLPASVVTSGVVTSHQAVWNNQAVWGDQAAWVLIKSKVGESRCTIVKKFKLLSLGALALCAAMPLCATLATAASDFRTFDTRINRTTNTWRYTEDNNFKYSQGSASQLLSVQELVLHHSLSIKISQNLTDSFTFRVGCMVQNPTPLFELKVNSLDIRLFDTLNDFVFARMMVDEGQEYSLRGEIAGSNRLVFAPITQAQQRSLSDLFLQMREGGQLQIGLLQGTSASVRTYKIPLSGFIQYADQMLQSCQQYNRASPVPMEYMPDYMAKEPEGYAPKDFTLNSQTNEEVIDPAAPKPTLGNNDQVITPQPVKANPTTAQPPEVLPFTPGGGPASIGPDGLPIGANGSTSNTQAGSSAANRSLGQAQGPMQIGADGMPIAPGANGTANNANTGANNAANGTSNTANTNNTSAGANGVATNGNDANGSNANASDNTAPADSGSGGIFDNLF